MQQANISYHTTSKTVNRNVSFLYNHFFFNTYPDEGWTSISETTLP